MKFSHLRRESQATARSLARIAPSAKKTEAEFAPARVRFKQLHYRGNPGRYFRVASKAEPGNALLIVGPVPRLSKKRRNLHRSALVAIEKANEKLRQQRMSKLVNTNRRLYQITEETYPEVNQRRCELIDKELGQGLTLEEEIELANLEAATDDYLDKVAPINLDRAQEILERLNQPQT